ncbi:MAG: alpha/beta hydrolase [Tessaracoccus sp.]|uniref:alpha/beta fold hydrolase n=1 Tax=Tessaracoccus sp. TaxID=1971211 RepID=UPI001EB5854A|nr:alpha/beta hydrolase [Tessaracoccus sp.]MBK7820028.1 alpha/beta hydrolase [Tessaracoccus sp.]
MPAIEAPSRSAAVAIPMSALAAALAVGWGVIQGVLLPRGPFTAVEAIVTASLSASIGLAAGWLSKSRLAVPLTPLLFAVAFEAARWATLGAYAIWPKQSTYGLVMLVTGRGVHGVFTLLPLALGALFGLVSLGAAARRRDAAAWAGRIVGAGGLAVLLFVCAVIMAPARTAPIVGADGHELPGSIAELTTVPANGHELALLIRGRSTSAPVVLFLAGGPGGSEMGAMTADVSLEQHAIVATWDQRGAGKSYAELDPVSTLTLEGAVADTIAVTEYLRSRFGVEKVYLVGQSWGTLLGVLAAKERPDLYHAFVGTGQMVSIPETDRRFYDDTLAWARATGRDDLERDLVRNGPPPYADLFSYEDALAHEHKVYPYDHSRGAEGQGGFSEHLFAQEYTPLERVHNLAAFLDTFAVLYPQLQDIDLRRDAAALDVPVVLIQGRNEAPGRAEPAREWFDALRAPSKEWIELDVSGHRPIFQQPGEFARAFAEKVL